MLNHTSVAGGIEFKTAFISELAYVPVAFFAIAFKILYMQWEKRFCAILTIYIEDLWHH